MTCQLKTRVWKPHAKVAPLPAAQAGATVLLAIAGLVGVGAVGAGEEAPGTQFLLGLLALALLALALVVVSKSRKRARRRRREAEAEWERRAGPALREDLDLLKIYHPAPSGLYSEWLTPVFIAADGMSGSSVSSGVRHGSAIAAGDAGVFDYVPVLGSAARAARAIGASGYYSREERAQRGSEKARLREARVGAADRAASALLALHQDLEAEAHASPDRRRRQSLEHQHGVNMQLLAYVARHVTTEAGPTRHGRLP